LKNKNYEIKASFRCAANAAPARIGNGIEKTMMYWARCCYGILRTNI
jgi:hypothetical protein